MMAQHIMLTCLCREEESQLLVRGNALAGGLGLNQGPAALAEKQAFTQLKAIRPLLRSDARWAPLWRDSVQGSVSRAVASARASHCSGQCRLGIGWETGIYMAEADAAAAAAPSSLLGTTCLSICIVSICGLSRRHGPAIPVRTD